MSDIDQEQRPWGGEGMRQAGCGMCWCEDLNCRICMNKDVGMGREDGGSPVCGMNGWTGVRHEGKEYVRYIEKTLWDSGISY